MKAKKVLMVLLLTLLAVIALVVQKFSNTSHAPVGYRENTTARSERGQGVGDGTKQLDRATRNLYYTKHAKCRMKCRHINEQEVRDILVNGTINYSKTELKDPKGPTYALEGFTSDRQHVRIIFAPKEHQLTVVTVIDLEVEYECQCN